MKRNQLANFPFPRDYISPPGPELWHASAHFGVAEDFRRRVWQVDLGDVGMVWDMPVAEAHVGLSDGKGRVAVATLEGCGVGIGVVVELGWAWVPLVVVGKVVDPKLVLLGL